MSLEGLRFMHVDELPTKDDSRKLRSHVGQEKGRGVRAPTLLPKRSTYFCYRLVLTPPALLAVKMMNLTGGSLFSRLIGSSFIMGMGILPSFSVRRTISICPDHEPPQYVSTSKLFLVERKPPVLGYPDQLAPPPRTFFVATCLVRRRSGWLVCGARLTDSGRAVVELRVDGWSAKSIAGYR